MFYPERVSSSKSRNLWSFPKRNKTSKNLGENWGQWENSLPKQNNFHRGIVYYTCIYWGEQVDIFCFPLSQLRWGRNCGWAATVVKSMSHENRGIYWSGLDQPRSGKHLLVDGWANPLHVLLPSGDGRVRHILKPPGRTPIPIQHQRWW